MLSLIFSVIMIFSNRAFADLTCSIGDSKPILVKHTKAGIILKVCGAKGDDFKENSKKLNLTYFSVTAEGLEGVRATPFQSKSELDNYLVSEIPDGLLIEELFYVDRTWKPLFKQEISCTSKECVPSKPECAFSRFRKVKQAPIGKALRLLKRGKVGDIDEVLIASLRNETLLGSQEALKVLRDPRMQKFLDGAAGEEFDSSMKTIEKALDSGCIK